MRYSQRLTTALSYVFLLFVTIVYVTPIVYMVIGSFKPDNQILSGMGHFTTFAFSPYIFDNYKDVFERVEFFRYLINSSIISASVVVFGVGVNALAGYAFARFNWRGKKLLLGLVFAIMIIPLEAVAIPMFYQLSMLGFRNTITVQIIPFVANAFFIYLFYTYYISLPKELEEAAYIDGAGPLRSFFFIIIPNSKPVLSAVAILAFLMQWSNFMWPLLMISQESARPLALAISTFYTLPPLQWGDLFAFGVMMVTPVIIMFLIFQKWFVQSMVSSGQKN